MYGSRNTGIDCGGGPADGHDPAASTNTRAGLGIWCAHTQHAPHSMSATGRTSLWRKHTRRVTEPSCEMHAPALGCAASLRETARRLLARRDPSFVTSVHAVKPTGGGGGGGGALFATRNTREEEKLYLRSQTHGVSVHLRFCNLECLSAEDYSTFPPSLPAALLCSLTAGWTKHGNKPRQPVSCPFEES